MSRKKHSASDNRFTSSRASSTACTWKNRGKFILTKRIAELGARAANLPDTSTTINKILSQHGVLKQEKAAFQKKLQGLNPNGDASIDELQNGRFSGLRTLNAAIIKAIISNSNPDGSLSVNKAKKIKTNLETVIAGHALARSLAHYIDKIGRAISKSRDGIIPLIFTLWAEKFLKRWPLN